MDERRILVVDDEQHIRDMYSHAFSQAGYTVKTVESAEEALAIMPKAPFMVLFLDLKLPGMDGVNLCRQIRKDWPMAICYALTGYASFYELSDCREAGFDDYFTKPTSLSDLLEAAEHAFKKIERWKRK